MNDAILKAAARIQASFDRPLLPVELAHCIVDFDTMALAGHHEFQAQLRAMPDPVAYVLGILRQTSP